MGLSQEDAVINSSSIKLFQRILFLNKGLFLRVLFATALISIFISIIIPPRYDSTISFYTKKGDSTSSFSNFDLSQLMLSGSPVVSNHDFSIIDILSSNDIYEKMLLKNYKSLNKSLIEYWILDQSFFNWSMNNDFNIDREIINSNVKKLKSRITFNENKKSGLISITASLESKQLSKEFIEVFFLEISNLLIQVNQKKSSDKVSFFNELTGKYKSELKEKEDELVIFLTNNKSINDSEILIAQKKRLERQVSILSNTYSSLLKELEMSKINQSDNLPLLVALDKPKEAHKKSFPQRKLIVVLSIIISMGVLLSYLVLRSDEFRKDLFESS